MKDNYITQNNELKNKLKKYIKRDKTNTLKYMFVNAIKSMGTTYLTSHDIENNKNT